MINIFSLITNVPIADDLNAMCDWFSDVKEWAKENGKQELEKDAGTALFFSNDKNRVVEYRRKLLSQLNTIAKTLE